MASEESTQQTQQSQQKQERVLGTTTLPLARVKRVIKEDKDVSLINAEATFCVAYATELFMEYLVKEGFTRARKEKRKTIYYKDLASAVSEVEQFEFLEDVIPHTMTLKAALERRKDTLDEGGSLESSRKKARVDHGESSETQQQQEDAMLVDSNGVRQEEQQEQEATEQQQPVEQASVQPDQESTQDQQTPST